MLSSSAVAQASQATKSLRDVGASLVADVLVKIHVEPDRLRVDVLEPASDRLLGSRPIAQRPSREGAVAVVGAVAEVLALPPLEGVVTQSVDQLAYTLYARALSNPWSTARGMVLLEEAIAIQEDFADAHGLLAYQHTQAVRWGRPNGSIAAAEAHIERALALDADSGWGHYARATVLSSRMELSAALLSYDLALDANRIHAAFLVDSAVTHEWLGQMSLATQLRVRAVEVAPNGPLAWVHAAGGLLGVDKERARRITLHTHARWPVVFQHQRLWLLSDSKDRAQHLEPLLAFQRETPGAGVNLDTATILLVEGRVEEAVQVFEAVTGWPEPGGDDDYGVTTVFALALRKAGRHKDADARIADALARLDPYLANPASAPEGPLWRYAAVYALTLSGDHDRAMRVLQDVVLVASPFVVPLELDPRLVALHDRPEWQAVVASDERRRERAYRNLERAGVFARLDTMIERYFVAQAPSE